MELLIVDDEKTALEAVEKGICWENLPFSKIHTAANVPAAKEILKNREIGLLLCDIEMPGESGLSLLEWINRERRDIGCIFMTCHADFSYAQQALRLGSFEYVLKPLDFQKLEVTLGEAAARLTQRRRLHQTQQLMERNRKNLTQQFWRHLFLGDLPSDAKSLKNYVAANGLDIDLNGCFVPVLISPSGLPENLSGEERRLLGFALRNVIEEIFSGIGDRNSLEALSNDRVLAVLGCPKDRDTRKLQKEIGLCCRDLLHAVDRYFPMQLCCYVGKKGEAEKVPEQLETLLGLELNNIIYQQFVIFSDLADAIYTEEYPHAAFLREAYRRNPENYKKIWEEIQEKLESMEPFPKDPYFHYQLFTGVYFLMNRFAESHHIFWKNEIDPKRNEPLLAAARTSREGLLEWLRYIGSCMRACENRGSEGRNVIDTVKGYIHANLDLELTAARAAQQVNFNVDYLNRIFKRETGIPLNQYILREKMERAKWLLENTQRPIGDVAAAVGYYNYSSFYRAFSKQVGCSPQEYKAGKVGI